MIKITHLFIAIILIIAKLPAQDLNKANEFLDSTLSANTVPNRPGYAALVIKNGEKIFQKCYGKADLYSGEELTPQTVFYLASLSKQFTTMGIMILKEKGKLNFEDKISGYFKDIPLYAKDITIRQLMTHTSGLLDHYDIVGEDISGLTNKKVYEIIKDQDSLFFIPGSKYKYSNSAYVLLALLIENISGKSLNKFFKENVFEPLKMESTLIVDENYPLPSSRAVGYSENSEGKLIKNDYDLFTTGGGGIYSNLADLYKWDQALYTDKLVSSKTLQEAWTRNKLNNGEPIDYGFGWMIRQFEKGALKGEDYLFHSGSLKGFRNAILRMPEKNFSIIILSNSGEHFGYIEEVAEAYLVE